MEIIVQGESDLERCAQSGMLEKRNRRNSLVMRRIAPIESLISSREAYVQTLGRGGGLLVRSECLLANIYRC